MKKLTALLLTLALTLSLAPMALAADKPTAQEALAALEKYITSGEMLADARAYFDYDAAKIVLKAAFYVDFDADGVPELVAEHEHPITLDRWLTVARAVMKNNSVEINESFAALKAARDGWNGYQLIRFGDGTYGIYKEREFPDGNGNYIDESHPLVYVNGEFVETTRTDYTELAFPTNRFAYYTAPAAAPAAPKPAVQVSTQGLVVNGQTINCEKYNIDGSNYFKLRDLAKLLSGTANQFEVGFANNTVTITTGRAYTPNGSELVTGRDQSSTAVVSPQKLVINGATVSDISAYNIGGNNYFKLRDLGDKLGFLVDYDEGTRTMIVKSTDYTPGAPVADTPKSTLPDGEYDIHFDYTYETVSNGIIAGVMTYQFVTFTDAELQAFAEAGVLPLSKYNSDWQDVKFDKSDIKGNYVDLNAEGQSVYYSNGLWYYSEVNGAASQIMTGTYKLLFPDTVPVTSILGPYAGEPEIYSNFRSFHASVSHASNATITIKDGVVTACTIQPSAGAW